MERNDPRFWEWLGDVARSSPQPAPEPTQDGSKPLSTSVIPIGSSRVEIELTGWFTQDEYNIIHSKSTVLSETSSFAGEYRALYVMVLEMPPDVDEIKSLLSLGSVVSHSVKTTRNVKEVRYGGQVYYA